ncbi:MAG: TorF family putative porin [Opitutaceae bacterium]|nr:TorF family putative porin [Opitutaceae bacterium]
MKKHALLLAAGGLFAILASLQANDAAAAAAAAAPSSSWVVTPTFVSQYMLRGVRLGGPAFQPAVEFDSGALALGIWTSLPLKNKVPGQSDPEVDPYGSYTIELVKDTLTLQPGFTLYTYPRAEKSNGFYKTTFEPSIALNYTTGVGAKFTPKIYQDLVLDGTTFELSAAWAIVLEELSMELDFTGTAGTFKWEDAFEDTTQKAKNWGNYWLLGVAAPFGITEDTKLTVGWAYTKGTENYTKVGSTPKTSNSSAVGRGVVTISCAIAF